MGEPMLGPVDSDYYHALNRNKRSLLVDISLPEGRKVIHDLGGECDIVVQNFRPSVVDRRGVSYDDLRQLRTGLIYCSISAFGCSGPWRDRPANDIIMQSVSDDGYHRRGGDARCIHRDDVELPALRGHPGQADPTAGSRERPDRAVPGVAVLRRRVRDGRCVHRASGVACARRWVDRSGSPTSVTCPTQPGWSIATSCSNCWRRSSGRRWAHPDFNTYGIQATTNPGRSKDDVRQFLYETSRVMVSDSPPETAKRHSGSPTAAQVHLRPARRRDPVGRQPRGDPHPGGRRRGATFNDNSELR